MPPNAVPIRESSEGSKRRPRKEGSDYKMMQNRRNVYAVQNNTGNAGAGFLDTVDWQVWLVACVAW